MLGKVRSIKRFSLLLIIALFVIFPADNVYAEECCVLNEATFLEDFSGSSISETSQDRSCRPKPLTGCAQTDRSVRSTGAGRDRVTLTTVKRERSIDCRDASVPICLSVPIESEIENLENRNWTCAWRVGDEKLGDNKDSCKDLRTEKLPLDTRSSASEEDARTSCYNHCVFNYSTIKDCIFVVSRSCSDLVAGLGSSLNTGSPFELPTAEINKLRGLSVRAGNPSQLIGRVIKLALSVAGTVALAMFVYGGLMWMTASRSGKDKNINTAKNIIIWAVLGVIVMLSSYALVDFIVDSVAVEQGRE